MDLPKRLVHMHMRPLKLYRKDELLDVYFVLSEVLRVSKITAAEQKFSFVFRLLDYCCECTSVDVEIVFSKSDIFHIFFSYKTRVWKSS